MGEAVKAVVQLKPGQTVCEEDLIALRKAQLGGAKAPKSVEFWLDLPRSAVGKLLKEDVRAKFWGDQWRGLRASFARAGFRYALASNL